GGGLDGGDAAEAHLAHRFVGEGVVEGTEAQAVGQAPAAAAELWSSEHVEQAQVDKEVAASLPQRGLDRGGGHGVVDDEGQVDVGGRVPADGPVERRTPGGVQQAPEVDFEPSHPVVEVVGGHDCGVDLAHDTDGF